MTQELHARVDAAWSRAWLGFGVVSALALGVVAWRVLGASPPMEHAALDAPVDAPPPSLDAAGPPDPRLQAASIRAGVDGKPPDHVSARDLYRGLCETRRDPEACTRVALLGGLLGDRALAPDWFEPAHAPLGELTTACDAGAALACAALELGDVDPERGAGGRARLCVTAGGGEDRTRCAAVVAERLCDDGDPEACAIAATPGASSADRALIALQAWCERDDLPSCLYAWRRAGSPQLRNDALLRACTDVTDRPRLASACRARAVDSPRRRELIEWACAAGDCGGVEDNAVLAAACDAGQLNGCAEALVVLRKTGMGSAAWKTARDAAARLAPEVAAELADTAVPPAAAGYLDACRYGSARGCDLAAGALPAESEDLRAYAARLREPLVNP